MIIPGAHRFDGLNVAILGVGKSGRAAIEALRAHTAARLGAWDSSTAAIDSLDRSSLEEVYASADPAQLMESLLGWGPDIVVIAPGFRQSGYEWATLRARGIRVWSEIELAWHLRAQADDGTYAPWLCVTGTNGKTTTVGMVESIVQAAGLRALAVGNVGVPAVTAVSDTSANAPQVFACELSSFQLAATYSMEPTSAIVLNLADDHLEWHSTREEYANAKATIYERTHRACVYPVGDSVVQGMVDSADVIEGARAIGVSLGIPSLGQLGFVEDVAVDRAFNATAHSHAEELFTLADLEHLSPEGYALPAHIAKDALAAAALARSIGIPASAVAQGLRDYTPGAHRIAHVATVNGVVYVDDSKATNAHAAQASLLGHDTATTIWIAGGLAKGACFDALVERVRDRLAGVVVIGVDQEPWRAALAHLDVPVTYIDTDAQDPMAEAVAQATALAVPGQTVLLAPACASQDQFVSYGERGDKFAKAVAELVASHEEE